jgi:hypothetical protein
MKRLGFKIKYIKRSNDGVVLEVAASFIEGVIGTIRWQETNIGNIDPDTKRPVVTEKSRQGFIGDRYLLATDLTFTEFKGERIDKRGRPMIIYDQIHFGLIRTEEEVFSFLESETKKDTSRKPFKKGVE